MANSKPMATDPTDAAEFHTHFYETGLVLKTSTAMRHWTAYAYPPATASRRAGKAKADDGTGASVTSMALGKYLLDNGVFQTGLSVFHHALERALRPTLRVALPAPAAQQLVAYYRSMMEALVQKVRRCPRLALAPCAQDLIVAHPPCPSVAVTVRRP